jgi:FkbH-like protein
VKLREALVIGNGPTTGESYSLQLCCGFEPLHLNSFLKAHLRVRLSGGDHGESTGVTISTGRFGDLAGNIERALSSRVSQPLAVVLEWADLDPRLGLREGYRPQPTDNQAILAEAAGRLNRIETQLTGAAAVRRIVLSLPATPLPPWGTALSGQASVFKLELRALLATFSASCARSGVRVAELPGFPTEPVYDFRSHLLNGFPYSNAFADLLAAVIADLLLPLPPKKGLVTDLDNTLWSGIVGDDGPADVHWSLEQHARPHGVYQQFLANLAAQGVLVAAASKNDPQPVSEALSRSDLLLDSSSLFPVETHWGPKSESLQRIAQAWNIGLDAIVFVDDNELELTEVKRVLPEVECHLFPSSDPAAALQLLQTLRYRFARERVTEEDKLRAASLRGAAEYTKRATGDPEAILAGLEARLVCSFLRDPFDPRAFELLNKTNQFNLNGQRWEESRFRAFLCEPDSVLCVASYEDRFGALGKIAVAAGTIENGVLRLASWVISCRAFSRRVEFAILEALFQHTGVDTLLFTWQSTPRNGPTREMLTLLYDDVPETGELSLTHAQFTARCPRLYAEIRYAS